LVAPVWEPGLNFEGGDALPPTHLWAPIFFGTDGDALTIQFGRYR
jgi:hypothetical protein